MSRRDTLTIRLLPSVRFELERRARADRRSLSATIEMILAHSVGVLPPAGVPLETMGDADPGDRARLVAQNERAHDLISGARVGPEPE